MRILNFLLLFFLSSGSNCLYYNDTPYLDQLKKADNVIIQNYYNPWHNQTIRFLENLSDSSELNQQCQTSLKRWINGIEDKEVWALKFLDATGKTINSKLLGRNVNFGSFEFCTRFLREDAENVDFDGKYCLVSVQTQDSEVTKTLPKYEAYYGSLSESGKQLLDFSIGNGHGVCVPSTCDINELTTAVNKIFKNSGLSILAPKKCTTVSEPERWDYLQLFSLLFLSTFIFLCFLSLFIKNDFLSNFSLIKNFNGIYKPHEVGSSFLHAPKALLMLCSITTHSFIYSGFFYSPPFAAIKEVKIIPPIEIFAGRILTAAGLMFFLGGMYSMFSWFDVIKNRPAKFNFWNYIKTRYIRIFIISIPVTLIIFILPHLGTGPYYSDLTNHLYQNCRLNGHKVFFLASNLNDRIIDMCVPGNWYFSADFQAAILSYFIIYYLVVKPKLAAIIILIECFFFSFVSILYNNRILGTDLFNAFDFHVYDLGRLEDVYFPFFIHFNSYVLGILCGYILKTEKRPKILDNQIVRISIWTILSFLSSWVFIYPYYIEQYNLKANWTLLTIHRNFGESILCFYCIFLLYTISVKYSRSSISLSSISNSSDILKSLDLIVYSVIRRISESKLWFPLSKLSFSISLCQFIFIPYAFAFTQDNFIFSANRIAEQLLINHTFTFILSGFVYLFFEAPLISIFKKYFGYKSRTAEVEKFNKKSLKSKTFDLNMNLKAE